MSDQPSGEAPKQTEPGIWSYRGVRIVESNDPKRARFRVELREASAAAGRPVDSQRVDSIEEARELIDDVLGAPEEDATDEPDGEKPRP